MKTAALLLLLAAPAWAFDCGGKGQQICDSVCPEGTLPFCSSAATGGAQVGCACHLGVEISASSIADPHPLTTRWLGNVSWTTNKQDCIDPFFYGEGGCPPREFTDSEVEFGLRSDGVMVWRAASGARSGRK